MIPKIIHYCWFGRNPKPEIVKKCIMSWRKLCPEYKLREWNEDNFDVTSCSYVKEAYENGKWAFVSDYVRLWVIYKEGGIYLDTDIELLKPLDKLLNYKAFFGYEDNYHLNTGIGFGAVKGNEMIYKILEDYNRCHFVKEDGTLDLTPCPERNSKVFEKNNFQLTGKTEIQNNIAFLSTEWLCPINYQTGEVNITSNTLSIHHYSGTWMSKEELKIIEIERRCKRYMGRKLAFWIRCRLYNIYQIGNKICKK